MIILKTKVTQKERKILIDNLNKIDYLGDKGYANDCVCNFKKLKKEQKKKGGHK
jgi:hypothetical protein